MASRTNRTKPAARKAAVAAPRKTATAAPKAADVPHIIDHDGNRVPLAEWSKVPADETHIIGFDGKRVLRSKYEGE